MSRYKAALIHFFISVSVFALFLSLVLSIWYVYPYHYTEGIISIIVIMAMVDVVLGPLLTLLLFKSGKKSLVFDIALIAVFQIAALLYGAHTVYSERPTYIVFGYNKFDVVARAEVNSSAIPAKIKKVGVFDKPVFVFQQRSSQPDQDELLFSLAALDGEDQPGRIPADVGIYQNYLDNRSLILENTKKVSESAALLSEGVDENLHYAIATGKVKQVIMLLNPEDASVLGFINQSKLLDF